MPFESTRGSLGRSTSSVASGCESSSSTPKNLSARVWQPWVVKPATVQASGGVGSLSDHSPPSPESPSPESLCPHTFLVASCDLSAWQAAPVPEKAAEPSAPEATEGEASHASPGAERPREDEQAWGRGG